MEAFMLLRITIGATIWIHSLVKGERGKSVCTKLTGAPVYTRRADSKDPRIHIQIFTDT